MPEREASEARLRLEVLTPEASVLDLEVRSLRLATDTGEVGLRPRGEAAVMALEPGLVLVRTERGTLYLATAGGIVRSDAARVRLLTPVAVRGDDPDAVLAQLDEALAQPGLEGKLRSSIGQLEAGILRELRAPEGRVGS